MMADMLNGMYHPWAASLWRAAWQGGLAILLVWMLCRLWPAVPPWLRVWLWRLAYLKLLAAWAWAGAVTLSCLPSLPRLPVHAVLPPLPAIAVHQLAAPAVSPTVSTEKPPAKSSPEPAPSAATSQPPTSSAPAQPAAHRRQLADLLPILGALWLLGITWGIIRLLLSMRLVHRLRREGRAVSDETLLRLRVQMVKQMGLRKAPMLLAHPTEGPLLLGMVHPVIIVPQAMLAGNEEELQLALAHELAHVRRRDILWGWLPVVAELLFFFHPLVYLARREYRLAQEIATDAQALHRTGAAPKTYGAMLVNGAAVQAGYRPVPVAVGIMESYLVLHRRLTAMKHFTSSPRQYAMAGILVCLLALIGLIPWRLSAADFTPNIPPPPKQPVPNARDIYLKAHEALPGPVKVSSGNNIYYYDFYDIYQMSTLGIMPGEGTLPARGQPAHAGADASPVSPDRRYKPTPTLALMQEMMRASQPAMDLLHQGFTAEYCEVPCRSFYTQLHHFAKFRFFTQVITAHAYTKSCSGDWSGAMESCLDGLRLGADVPHGGVHLSMRVGTALQKIARQQVWEIIPHLSTSEAGAASRRWESIMASQVPMIENLQEEKWYVEAGLLELFNDPNWKETLARDFVGEEVGNEFQLVSKSTLYTNLNRYLDAQIEQARRPYAARGPEPLLPDDPISKRWFSRIYHDGLFPETFSITQNSLLLVSLALQAYHAEHNAYPATLVELTPAYLKAVPDDPFALQAPLCYQRTETGYLLYSIGPDGKDDGGIPCSGGQKAGDKGVVPEAIGDIVAGVNLW